MTQRYLDFDLMKSVPNKYNLTLSSIKKLTILDWSKLKEKTWFNEAMRRSGTWYCHLEGCNPLGSKYDDFSEFWIGFREDDNKIDCNFTTYEGMCSYKFSKFYSVESIDNRHDMNVQANCLRWINEMIDNGILGLPD